MIKREKKEKKRREYVRIRVSLRFLSVVVSLCPLFIPSFTLQSLDLTHSSRI